MKLRRILFLLLVCVAISARAVERKPNVIFILADDLGYGELGCYGQQKIKTPNIDSIARDGIRFTQAYAGCSVCAPSRCTLMTGKHTGHAAVRGNKEIKPEGQAPMPADTFTVAHLMKQAGYATGAIGKWGLGFPGSASTPEKMGFDYFFGYNCQRMAHEYYPQYLWRNDEKVMLNGKKYSHDLLADDSLEFVRKNHAHPFFLYVPFTIPHANYQVPDLGPYATEPWPEEEKKYAAMVTRMDDSVGRLLALLKELGIDENTLVIFSSDNGVSDSVVEHHDPTGHRAEFFNGGGGLHGKKTDVYEGGIRTPVVARWPGKIKPGVVSDQVWAFWDFLPTMAELVGAKPPAGIDGVSVLPALLNGKSVAHAPLYWEFHGHGFWQALRIGDWKAVRLGTQKPVELYDLKTDVAEKHDVAVEHPDIVAKAVELFKTVRTDSAEFPVREKSTTKPQI